MYPKKDHINHSFEILLMTEFHKCCWRPETRKQEKAKSWAFHHRASQLVLEVWVVLLFFLANPLLCPVAQYLYSLLLQIWSDVTL